MPGQFEGILDKLQTKLGKQTIKRASTINRPRPKFEVQQIDIFNKFNRRNPKADGGSVNGSYEAALRKKIEELMDDGYEFGEAVREAMRQGYKSGGVAGLFENKNGSLRLSINNKNAGIDVDKYFPANKKALAVKEAKQIQKIIKESTKGFLTRAELAKKLGITFGTIERYKVDKNPIYDKIKELFEIKKTGATSPELYKPKSKTAISALKKVVEIGNLKPKKTYGGKKTTMQKVKDILNNSEKPITEQEAIKKLKGVPKDTIRTSFSVLKKDPAFKDKISLMGSQVAADRVAQIKATKRVPLMTAIRNQFVADPSSDLEDVTRAIYGDKKFNSANKITKQKYLTDTSRQVPKFLAMFAPGSKLKYPGFKDIKADKLGEILTNIEIRTNDFGFETGTLRQLRNAIADAARGLPERTTDKMVSAVRQTGKAVDEVVGQAATFERAPGYIEATQIIDEKVNSIKGKRLDPEFSRVFGKTLAGDFSEVKSYNKKAKAFGKKYNIDVPLIKTGKNLKPEKLIKNFEDFSEGAQKNIKDIAKEKGVVVKTKSKPLQALFKAVKPVAKVAGKVIKPLGIVTGLAAVNTAAQAGERNPFDLAGAYITGDPEVATTGRRIRQEPEFRTQYMADLLSRPLDEGTYDVMDESFTSYFDGGIVSVLKGVK